MQSQSLNCPVKILKVHPKAALPRYEHSDDTGADVFAVEDTSLKPNEWQMIPTGLRIEYPSGFDLQIRPRSGLSSKYGITVLNTPGTIDPGYRGELKVILINLGTETFHVKQGCAIAQIVILPVARGEFTEVDELSESTRGAKGFGSSGSLCDKR